MNHVIALSTVVEQRRAARSQAAAVRRLLTAAVDPDADGAPAPPAAA